MDGACAHGAERAVYISPTFIGDYATNSKTIRTKQLGQHNTEQIRTTKMLLSAHDAEEHGFIQQAGTKRIKYFGTHTCSRCHLFEAAFCVVRSTIVSTVTVVCVALFGVLMLLDYPWSPTGLRSLPKISTAHRLLPYHDNSSNTIMQ